LVVIIFKIIGDWYYNEISSFVFDLRLLWHCAPASYGSWISGIVKSFTNGTSIWNRQVWTCEMRNYVVGNWYSVYKNARHLYIEIDGQYRISYRIPSNIFVLYYVYIILRVTILIHKSKFSALKLRKLKLSDHTPIAALVVPFTHDAKLQWACLAMTFEKCCLGKMQNYWLTY